ERGEGGLVSDLESRLKALMRAGLAGDAAAHSELLRVMTGYLRGYFARRLGRGVADVEDLVQETLLAIHVKRETWDNSYPFTAWAYSVARYKLIDHYRRQKVRRTEPLEAADALFASADVEEGEARRDLGRLLSELPQRQRGLLEDVKLRGLSHAEAAKKVGMS